MPSLRLAANALLIAFFATSSLASEPGMAGEWQLDVDRSESIQPNQPVQPLNMSIQFVGDDLSVALSSPAMPGGQFQYSYITDGKPHDVPGLGGNSRRVRAKWSKKGVLQASYTNSFPGPRGAIDLDTIESWKLSKDQSELKVTYTTRIPDRRPRIVEQVWTRPGS